MSDAARVSANAIAALLGGLADALTDAQRAMADLPPVDAFGRPLPSYRIPELDFRFEIEMVQGDTAWWDMRPAGAGAPSGTVSSTITGKIVAVPPNGGLPETRIEAIQRGDSLDIRVTDAAGGILAGEAVELEVDPEASRAVFDATIPPAARLSLLKSQRLRTDTDGVAKVALVRGGLPRGAGAVILVRAAGSEVRVGIGREG